MKHCCDEEGGEGHTEEKKVTCMWPGRVVCGRSARRTSYGELEGWKATVGVLSHKEKDSVIAGGSLRLSGGFWSGGERPRGVGILCV